MTATILPAALDALRAGLSVLPPKEDGTKAPDAKDWKRYQTARADEAEVRTLYANGRTGLGVVCGAVSGGLEMFEFEGRAIEAGVANAFIDAAEACGLGALVSRIAEGYTEATPSGGLHWLFRTDSPVTTKLARRPATESELAEDPDNGVKPLIETKGEGGFTITAPSHGTVHSSGRPWELVTGGFATIATIAAEEQRALHDLARTFDQMPRPALTQERRPAPRQVRDDDVVPPGADYNARATWAEVLQPAGWSAVYTRGPTTYWRRPGKVVGISATTNHEAGDVLWVFSSSTEFEPDTSYSRFGAYAQLHHAGDFAAAARALREQGYGSPRKVGATRPQMMAARTSGSDGHPEVVGDGHHEVVGDPEFFVDWSTFWDRDRNAADWLYDDVLARGRGHAVYASNKTGKSLLMLWLAALMARRGVAVVYLDYEMTDDDLYERLADMGYGPATDLSHLHYAVLPTLPPLDTDLGALTLLAKVDEVRAIHPGAEMAVVIDTTARAVAGEENSSDTFRDFYRFTGTALKRRGVTWARLDHAGKDAGRGQRGSSAKGDDVDVVWRLARTDNGLELRREVSRMGWVPDKVVFRQQAEPLRFTRVDEDWPAGTAEVAAILDRLGVPPTAGERPAGQAMREAGHQRTQSVVRAAQKYRRQVVGNGHR